MKKIKQENSEWEDYEIQKPDGSWTTVANLLAQERKLERDRIQQAIVQFAIEGKDVDAEWRGAALYAKTMKYFDKLKKEGKE